MLSAFTSAVSEGKGSGVVEAFFGGLSASAMPELLSWMLSEIRHVERRAYGEDDESAQQEQPEGEIVVFHQ